MASAAVLAGSGVFFIIYLAIAEAFGVLGTSRINSIDAPTTPPDRGGILGAVDSLIQIYTFGFDLMARFFMLITFQAPGLEGASMVTAVVFIPLTIINGWIIFRGIRG